MSTTTTKKRPHTESTIKTLFVSNIPFSTTSSNLSDFFSEYGPVRRAFIVGKEGESKGVGYVTFAERIDAEKVISLGEGEGVLLDGRKVGVEWASKKEHKDGQDGQSGHDEEGGERKTKRPRLSTTTGSPPKPKPPKNPDAQRSLVFMDLPSDVEQKALWKKVRKIEGCQSISSFNADARSATVLFMSPRLATYAVPKLHAHQWKGSVLNVTLTSKSSAKLSKANRVIIRNLPFNVKDNTLKDLIVHLVPLPPNAIKHEEGKGFAFVQFYTKPDAEKVIENLNGKEIEGRTVAVDWALGKDKWKEVEGAMEDAEDDDAKEDEESEDEDNDDEKSVEEDDGEEEGDEDEKASDLEDDDDVETSPGKSLNLPTPSQGTTLFVRNVGWDTTPDEFRETFTPHGPLVYALLTMDRSTTPPRPRGTGFVCYKKPEDAERVIELASKARATMSLDTSVTSTAPGKNPFTLPSILTPDPSSSTVLATGLVLKGRVLDVVRAVERGEASKLEQEGENKRKKEDKRNLYLLKETLPPNDPSIPEEVKEQRRISYRLRKRELERNPLLYVSKTRLSIRGLQKWVSEVVLGKIVSWAVENYSGAEIHDEEKEEEDGQKAKEKKGGNKLTSQIKLLRDAAHTDPLTNKGKSKGLAFVEMTAPVNALKVVRVFNNAIGEGLDEIFGLTKDWYLEELQRVVSTLEKEKGKEKDEERKERIKLIHRKIEELKGETQKKGGTKTLIVEFAIENAQVVRSRAERMTRVDREKVRSKVVERTGGKRMFDGVSSRSSRPTAHDKKKGWKGDAPPTEKIKMLKLSEAVKTEKTKVGRSVGSLIGRKRKERRGKKG